MSGQLYEYAKKFAAGEISADDFADPFMERWKRERDAASGAKDPDELSECPSSIFCLADLYNPRPDREGHELDESELRSEVRKAMRL